MKNLIKILTFFTLSFHISSANADVLEIGGGFTESYNGEFPLWSDSGVKMESLSMPITISLMIDKLRIGYIDYKQYARDFSSSTSAYAKVDNSILSFNYFGKIIEDESMSFNYFAGLGLFRSYYEVNLTTAGRSDDYAINIIGNSSKSVDPGLIIGLGYHKNISKGFIGLNLTYIPSKKITYDYSWVKNKYYIDEWNELEEVDISGNIIFLVTGINF